MIIYVALKELEGIMKEVMNMKNNNYIGEIINNKRKRLGTSIRKLSRLIGLSPTTICDLVKGNIKKHVFESVLKLSRVLDIDMNDFIKNEKTIYMDVSKDYTVTLKRIDENCV